MSPTGAVSMRRDTRASLGSVSLATRDTKSGALRTSRGTGTAPARNAPKKPMTHWGMLGPQKMTRSPFWTPWSWSHEAACPAASHSCRYDQARYLNDGFTRSAGLGPYFLADSSSRSTSVSTSIPRERLSE